MLSEDIRKGEGQEEAKGDRQDQGTGGGAGRQEDEHLEVDLERWTRPLRTMV